MSSFKVFLKGFFTNAFVGTFDDRDTDKTMTEFVLKSIGDFSKVLNQDNHHYQLPNFIYAY